MDLVTGCLLIIGDAVAYAHQVYVVSRDSSTKGLSSITVCLNFLSSLMVFVNFYILDSKEYFLQVFFHGLTLESFDNLIAFLQIMFSVVYTGLFLLAFMMFNDTGNRNVSFWINFVVFFSMGITFSFFFFNGMLSLYAEIIGVIAAVVTMITWLPQIFSLLRWRDAGELSMVLVLTHVVGAIIAVFFQAVLNAEPWSTWISTIVLAFQHSLILFLLVLFKFKRKKDEGSEGGGSFLRRLKNWKGGQSKVSEEDGHHASVGGDVEKDSSRDGSGEEANFSSSGSKFHDQSSVEDSDLL